MSNVSVVEAFINAIRCGDVETALNQLDEDVHVSEPARMPLGLGGDYNGKRSFIGFLHNIAAVYDVKVRGMKVIDGDDLAVALVDLTWTAHSTGASLETQFCELYTVSAGKITGINVFPKDTAALHEIAVGPQ